MLKKFLPDHGGNGERLFYADRIAGEDAYVTDRHFDAARSGETPDDGAGFALDDSGGQAGRDVDADVLATRRTPSSPLERDAPAEDKPEEDEEPGDFDDEGPAGEDGTGEPEDDQEGEDAEGGDKPRDPFANVRIRYADITDDDLVALPERDRGIARELFGRIREKDREAYQGHLEGVKKALAPTLEFQERYGKWDLPLQVISGQPALEEVVAESLNTYVAAINDGKSPEEAVAATRASLAAGAVPADPEGGKKPGAEKPGDPAADGKAPAKAAIPKEMADRLAALREEVNLDEKSMEFLEVLSQATTGAMVQAVANDLTAQFNKVLAPLQAQLRRVEGHAVKTSLEEQEKGLVRQYGDMARPYLQKDQNGHHAIDRYRAEAAREGRVLSTSDALAALMMRDGKIGGGAKPPAGRLSSGSGGRQTLRGKGTKTSGASLEDAKPQVKPGMRAAEMRRVLEAQGKVAK